MQRAKELYQSSVAHYQAGEYPAAHADMLASYQISHLPDLLYNLSRTADKMGRTGEAMNYLEAYLRERPDAPDAPQIQAEIKRLKALQAEAPPPAAVPAKPALPATATTAPKHEAPRVPPGPALGLMGGGLVLAVIGAGLGGGASAAARAIESKQSTTAPPPFDAGLQATQAQGKGLAAGGAALGTIGALAMGAGVAWTAVWIVKRRKAEQHTAALLPQGLGLTLAGSF